MKIRKCSKLNCQEIAAATLTYSYSDLQAVLGPLGLKPEVNSSDLCKFHAENFSVPRGWELIRLPGDFVEARPSVKDLEVLAAEIRAAAIEIAEMPAALPTTKILPRVVKRKGHLAVLADPK